SAVVARGRLFLYVKRFGLDIGTVTISFEKEK
ncbi:MAG: hypothetical protein NWR52_05610, partial [Paracoccaceae bacterium]|nr:hypothetical protein [Paracoccaceae bacterium]